MKLIRKISGLLIIIMLTTSLTAQTPGCIIKKIYPADIGTSLYLANKFGDVNILTIQGDSLTICATITIDQNDKELLEKSIKLIDINIDKVKDSISISTSFDRKFFSQTYRQGRKRFTVNYIIETPDFVNVRIINEFGNISVDELSGSVYIKLSQGVLTIKNLTRGNIKPINQISIDHSTLIINKLNWTSLNVANCPSIYIENGQAILMDSEFSKIEMGNVSSLVANTKSDSYSISSIKNLVSESIYSTFELGSLTGQFKSLASFGSINISNLNREFSMINMTLKHTPIIIKTDKEISFQTDIAGTNSPVDFRFENEPGITKTVINNLSTYKGVVGEDKKTNSIIKIRSVFGAVSIR
jgi:hypothetical protein